MTVAAVHRAYYTEVKGWAKNTYCGVLTPQLPADLWLMQEIIWQEKPPFLIETGVYMGGSLLFYAHVMDKVGKGLVIGIDKTLKHVQAMVREHPRVRLIEGSSTDQDVVMQVARLVPPGCGMVTLDSDHHKGHVLREMQAYFQFVERYMVVQDTHLNVVEPQFGPGPIEAVDEFLKNNDSFVRDDMWERNLFSFHQGGWLRRVK